MNNHFGRDFKQALFSIAGAYDAIQELEDYQYLLVSYDQVSDDFQMKNPPFHIMALRRGDQKQAIPVRCKKLEKMLFDSNIDLRIAAFDHHMISIKKLLAKRCNFVDQEKQSRISDKKMLKKIVASVISNHPHVANFIESRKRIYPFLIIDKGEVYFKGLGRQRDLAYANVSGATEVHAALTVNKDRHLVMNVEKLLKDVSAVIKERGAEQRKNPGHVSPAPAEKGIRDSVLNMDGGYGKLHRFWKLGFKNIVLTNAAVASGDINDCVVTRSAAPRLSKELHVDQVMPVRYISINKLLKDRYKFKEEKQKLENEKEMEWPLNWPVLEDTREGFKKGEMVAISASRGAGRPSLEQAANLLKHGKMDNMKETSKDTSGTYAVTRTSDVCEVVMEEGMVTDVRITIPLSPQELEEAVQAFIEKYNNQ